MCLYSICAGQNYSQCHGVETEKPLSGTAEEEFHHLATGLKWLFWITLSCSIFSCCPEGHGCQHYFFMFANALETSPTMVSQITPNLSSDQAPVILIAFGHGVRWCLKCISTIKSHAKLCNNHIFPFLTILIYLING